MKKVIIGLILCMLPSVVVLAADATEQNQTLSAESVNIEALQNGRFVYLFADDEYKYYLDRQTARQINHPYLNEKLLDVWLKIVSNTNAVYADPDNYIMQHYFVRLKEKQLQLVNEVVFNGETAFNNDPDIPYREKNWRTVVPSSSDEGCYLEIVKYMNKNQSDKNN